MVKRLFIATFVAISPLYALAQGLITGSIKDARNGEALIGASVIVKSERVKEWLLTLMADLLCKPKRKLR
jgi:hypothetical protein